MIRAFLFDIGNVLVRFDFAKAIRALAPLCEAVGEAELLRRLQPIQTRYENGQMPRREFIAEASASFGYRGTGEQFVSAWQGIFSRNDSMLPLVGHLRKRHPLFLLSNTNDMHVEGLFRDFEIFRHFAGGTYSHAVRASKPHRAIYEIACRQHGLDPATTFFIDDLAANIATAREMDFQTHHYHHEGHGELVAALRAAGVEL